ncbi:MarR family transcriptional regulator [Ruegeria atlantica]|uniref:MarR family transcriptional regulator n=1 Tax=Ruegeria atlantica TaxID=81569 RepID=UPI00147DA26B|nr:MarR family transcriptional regulator [Ruegeria atlantica]
MHTNERTANLLGTLSTAVANGIDNIDASSLDHGASAAAALVTIGNYPKQNVTELSVCLRLSHSATVRLVDRLAASGLIIRNPGRDKRALTLALTHQGEEFVGGLQDRRRAALEDLLHPLDDVERRLLTGIMERMLIYATRSQEDANQLCRFCDLEICPQDDCPVEKRARQLR